MTNSKRFVLLMIAVLLISSLHAQIPTTPAGRQLAAWMKAQDSLDRATIQQFIDKYMTWARVDGELAMRNQTGGFEVKRVEESNDTHLVVLAQERGPLKQ